MRCKFCNTENPKDFNIYKCKYICDDCMSILNYHMADAFKELQEVYRMRCNSGELWESEFNEGLEEYTQYEIDEYNRMINKERRI